MSDNTIDTCLTASGLALLAQSQLGTTLTFTKLEIGDGELGDTDATTLTALINPVQELAISSKTIIDSVTLAVSANLSQGDMGYTFREIGLYAADPDTGDEVLYAYGNKGDSATYIPANTSSMTIDESVLMVITVGNSSNVTITIASDADADAYATKALDNLEQTGENKLNYNVCCANSGDTNDDGTPAFLSNVESSTITSSYSSSGISNFAVDTSVYFDNADYNDYVFTYDGSDWLLDDEAADLADYGITFDEKFTVSEYYTSDTVTSVSINSVLFLNTVENIAGTYTFTAAVTSEDVTTEDDDGETTTETVTTTVWTLDDAEITLDDYGITYEGEASDGDTITVTVTSLLTEDDTITVIVAQTFTLTTSGEFVVTTAYGKSYTITDTLTLDVTGYDDGEYNLFVDPVENTLSALSNTITADITFPDDANDGDYLLNTAKIPYDLQKINISADETTITTGLNEVYIGTLTITGGGVA